MTLMDDLKLRRAEFIIGYDFADASKDMEFYVTPSIPIEITVQGKADILDELVRKFVGTLDVERPQFIPDRPSSTVHCAVCSGPSVPNGMDGVYLCGDHSWIFRAAGPKGLFAQVHHEIRQPAWMDSRKMRARERRLEKYMHVLRRMIVAQRAIEAQAAQDNARRDAVEFD